jgi:pimeloyl-ACP methyl ester carboxylesterase
VRPLARPSTVLFVHGAHHAGWCWLLVMEHLGRRGIESQAIDLPFTGYQDDVDAVRTAITRSRRTAGAAVHVVGHSYGGLPVAEAGHGAAHLTFVAGRLPRPGESPAAETARWQSPAFRACSERDGDRVVRLSRAAAPLLFHRTDPGLAQLAMDRMRPMVSTVPTRPVADPAWLSVPSSYVVCADDRVVRPDAQRERAALVGASVELDTDHSPFFSSPAALADFIADRHRVMAAA